MNVDVLTRRFLAIGGRLKVRRLSGTVRPRGESRDFSLDIARDALGEYFDLGVALDSRLEFTVLEARPRERHLLLLARNSKDPRDPPSNGENGKSRFLCGHDERHWFVAAVPRGSTVRDAKEALKPIAARVAQVRNRVKPKDWNKRRNAGFLRQGEWFFIPAPDLRPDPRLILEREPIRRGWGKPHIVQFLYRRGGQTVYVSHKRPNGVTESEYTRLLDKHPEMRKLSWRVMRREPEVFARGWVRHPDHRTIVLPFWHRVLSSTETRSASVAFLD